MPELSLTRLAEGRPGVWIRSVTCWRERPPTDATALEAAGLKDLQAPGGMLFGLPQRVAQNETLLNVRLGKRTVEMDGGEEEPSPLEDWILSWEQLTKKLAETVPERVIAESASFGGSAGLEERVLNHMKSLPNVEESDSDVIVSVQYALTGWTSKLLRLKPRRFGQLSALPLEARWHITEADVLMNVWLQRVQGVSRYHDEDMRLTAFAVVDDDDDEPLDVPAIEGRVWQDVFQLLEEPK